MHSPRLVILADAHLGAAPADDEAAMLRFLDTVPREGDTLLLAGDIFDFWFSYRRLIPRRNFRVTAALTTLARRIPVAMIGGNHDRWGDSFWRDDAGITFEPHRLRLPYHDQHVLAIHGDGLHEERPGAAWMHKATSSRLVIGLFRSLHPDLGFRIADGISERVVFREFFPIGLTALDDFEEHVLGTKPTLSHLAARQEIRQLLAALRLPTDELDRKRVEARRRFAETIGRPIVMPDIFAN